MKSGQAPRPHRKHVHTWHGSALTAALECLDSADAGCQISYPLGHDCQLLHWAKYFCSVLALMFVMCSASDTAAHANFMLALWRDADSKLLWAPPD